MEQDEQAIRDLVAEWQHATTTDDVDTVLSLMADDAMFLTPGEEPFGKERFAKSSRDRDIEVEGRSEIEEIEIAGDWAWARTHIVVKMTQPSGESNERSGYTMTIFRREVDGRWVLARDANLLPPPS